MSDLQPFGADRGWLAVRNAAPAPLVEALGLTDARYVTVEDAVASSAGGSTAIMPALPGVDGHWTLVVGGDVAEIEQHRAEALSAMLGTDVQVFGAPHEGERRCLLVRRGAVVEQVDVPDSVLPDLAARWSIDPTTLSGPAPGSAAVVDPLRPVPPTPDNDPTLPVVRHEGFWSRLFARRER